MWRLIKAFWCTFSFIWSDSITICVITRWGFICPGDGAQICEECLLWIICYWIDCEKSVRTEKQNVLLFSTVVKGNVIIDLFAFWLFTCKNNIAFDPLPAITFLYCPPMKKCIRIIWALLDHCFLCQWFSNCGVCHVSPTFKWTVKLFRSKHVYQ